ncbi:MAG: hypothetical protein P8Y91_13005 [Desulfuromonadales bacterium]
MRRFEVFDELLVRETSQLCIDGFPRSANTFLTLFFSHWNPNAAVAHHVHLPLQVRMAVKYRVPTIVLIRPPLDAITSLLIREKFLHLWVALIAYRLFYRQVARYRESFVLADFATVLAEIRTPSEVWENLYLAAGGAENLLLLGFKNDDLKAVPPEERPEKAAHHPDQGPPALCRCVEDLS